MSGGMYSGHERRFFQEKNCNLAGFAAGIRRISAKSGEGGGRTFFLVHQLFKKSFGTSQSP
ncbi:MAG: hypothetical protein PUD50_00665, partial [Eubacteriales bacterium]|nr:hypothetical protein [Eubacteriales bacterium]